MQVADCCGFNAFYLCASDIIVTEIDIQSCDRAEVCAEINFAGGFHIQAVFFFRIPVTVSSSSEQCNEVFVFIADLHTSVEVVGIAKFQIQILMCCDRGRGIPFLSITGK